MRRSQKNKENNPITEYYRVSKRLTFEPNKSDNASPASNLILPSSPACVEDDSPYLYEIRRKQNAPKMFIQATSTPLSSAMDQTPLKRSGCLEKQRTSKLCIDIMDFNDVIMESPSRKVCFDLDELEKGLNPEQKAALTGDFSKKCTLTVMKGKHPELSTVNIGTIAELLSTWHNYDITIIDCRYPYEFSAGHIKSAINLFRKEDVEKHFFDLAVTSKKEKSNLLLLFYCEFSSERAPSMMRFMRETDRRLNADIYPFVYYPELYLIDGGYKSFFANFKELCEPQNYKPMLAKENTADYAHYKSICRGCDYKLLKDSENK